jgi:hypothetical protein
MAHVNRRGVTELAMKKNLGRSIASGRGPTVKPRSSRDSVRPLDYMMKTINDETLPLQLRDAMAKAALPFMHRKLPAIAFDEADYFQKDNLDLSKLSDEELEQLGRLLAKSETKRA